MPARLRTRPAGLPPSGAKAIFIGDSITDPNSNGGGYAAKLASQCGWQLLGGNLLVEGTVSNNFEGVTTGWVATAATLTSDTAHAAHGTNALKVVATGTTCWANPAGDTGGLRLTMQPATTYTFSCDLYVPTGTTGTIALTFLDQVGTAGYQVTTSATVAPANAWQRVGVTRTVQTGATEAFVRVSWTGATVGQAIWVDGAVVEPGSFASAWQDNALRPALAGTLLQSTDNFANNFQASIATRFAPWVAGGVDLIVLYMGTNDLSQVATSAHWTRAAWRAALDAAFAAFTTILPVPRIVVCSLGSLTVYADATAVAQWGTGITRAMIYSDMNAITQQACRDYGALYLPFTGETDAMTVDHIHPNQSGNDYFVAQFKALFGQ